MSKSDTDFEQARRQLQRESFVGLAKSARALAETIANNGTKAIRPSDSSLCEDALRAYAAHIEAGFALLAPAPRAG
jgi:hypothetical protein